MEWFLDWKHPENRNSSKVKKETNNGQISIWNVKNQTRWFCHKNERQNNMFLNVSTCLNILRWFQGLKRIQIEKNIFFCVFDKRSFYFFKIQHFCFSQEEYQISDKIFLFAEIQRKIHCQFFFAKKLQMESNLSFIWNIRLSRSRNTMFNLKMILKNPFIIWTQLLPFSCIVNNQKLFSMSTTEIDAWFSIQKNHNDHHELKPITAFISEYLETTYAITIVLFVNERQSNLQLLKLKWYSKNSQAFRCKCQWQ